MLSPAEIPQAVEIMNLCWNNDYSPFAPHNYLPVQEVTNDITGWVTDTGADDWRILFGAFVGNEMAGFIGASYAELEDSPNGIEINYLFVQPQFRNRGIAGQLLSRVLNMYQKKKPWDEVIIYTFAQARSHQFYQKHGAKKLRSCLQELNHKPVQVDVYSILYRDYC